MLGKIVYLWCDRCHTIGPDGDTVWAVRQAAKKLGWSTKRPTTGHPHTTPALCPQCQLMHALIVAP